MTAARAQHADALHRLLADEDGRAFTVADIYRLRDLQGWPRKQVRFAVVDLIFTGRMRVGPQGTIELASLERREAA